MIPEIWIAIALSIPLIMMIAPSISYWKSYRLEKKNQTKEKINQPRKAEYDKLLFKIFISGVFGMWIFWISGILLSISNSYQTVFMFSIYSSRWDNYIQVCGLGFFFLGGFGYNWVLQSAGKYVQPAPSGTLQDHKLITTGPFGMVRHPLYVSYVCILVGLFLTLRTYLIIIPLLLAVVGIKSTARAEEIVLIKIFGDQYIQYQEEV
jgi:protein-S-isoprenylcysteine O-methyltransferase Ste14